MPYWSLFATGDEAALILAGATQGSRAAAVGDMVCFFKADRGKKGERSSLTLRWDSMPSRENRR